MEYKGYDVVGDGTFGNKVIKSIGPGLIPKKLSGSFTTALQAHRVIDVYVNLKEEEAVIAQIRKDSKPTPVKYKQPKKD